MLSGHAPAVNYPWKTEKAWEGACRQFLLKLSDGTIHRVNVTFTK